MELRKAVKRVSQLLVPVVLFATVTPSIAADTTGGMDLGTQQAASSASILNSTPAGPPPPVTTPTTSSATAATPSASSSQASDTTSVPATSHFNSASANGTSSAPTTTSSSTATQISNVDASFGSSTSSQKVVAHELVTDRTANSVRFQNADGTYTTKIYADPINYKDKTGNWQSIDSTLSMHQDGRYHNAANLFDVSLPPVANGGMISFAKDGATASMEPTFAGNIKGNVSKNSMTYKNVATDTDLTYAITSNGLKESIVLNAAQAPTTFSFKLNVTGATYKQEADGSVDFFIDGSSDPAFSMPKPYMVDAKGNLSSAVSYQFDNDAAGDTIVNVVADPTWLQQSDRAFPVIVDPSVNYNTGMGNTFVSQSNAGTNYSNYQHIYVGGASSSFGVARTLFKFSLPTLPTGASITSATLNVDNTNDYVTNQTPVIEIHRITSNNWTLGGVNWNNQPAITSTADETYTVNNQAVPNAWYLPMTSIVKGWYNGLYANNGLELKYADESQVIREILGSADTTDPQDHAYITVNYTTDGMGSEPFWTFDGPVNMTNMNLVLPETDVSFPGRRVEVPLSRTYNSRMTTLGVFGYGWTSALDMRLYAQSGGPARLVGSNGTTYFFNPNSSGGYDSPSGMYWTFNLSAGSSATITTIDKTVYTYTPVPNQSGVYELSTVKDANGNTLTYVWNSSNQVTSIQDGAGHAITLTYSGNLIATATDPAGSKWTYGYTNNNLTSVTQPDGKTIEQYRYDGSHHLTATVSPANRITYYDYTTDSTDSTSYRVTAINPKNMVTNGNLEVSSGGNHLPDHFNFDSGYNNGSEDTTDWTPYGPTSFSVSTSSSNSSNYAAYLSDPISVNPSTAYTLSGYMRGSQTSGTLTTVLSLYAYDASGNYISEVARTAPTGTFNFARYTFTLDPSNGTGLPSNTATVKLHIAASESGGSGTSWWDGLQLEEGTTATSFVSGADYNYYPPNSMTAAYDGDGRKHLYTYNSDQNLTTYQVDPNGLNLTTTYNWSGDRTTSYTDPNSNQSTYSSNTKNGEIATSTDPYKNQETYTYDDNNDVIQNTLVNGAVNNYTYDSTRDQLTSTDPYGTTVGTTYDAYGNVTSVSEPVGSVDNLIDNTSFEEDTQSDGITPVHFNFNSGQAGWYALNTQNVVSGTHSLTIAAQDGVAGQTNYSVLTSDPVTINSGIGYLLSGELMATQSSVMQATFLSVYAYDSNGNFLSEIGKMELDGASGWQRWRTVILPSDIPAGTTQFRVKVAGRNTGGYGNSYFDNLQLQPNIVDTEYNLIDNASFERGPSGGTWPSDWTQTTSGTDTWVTSPVYSEGHAVAVANATSTTGIDSTNYWTYNNSKNYTLTVLVKTSGLSANVGQVKIDEYDSNYNQIGNATSAFIGGSSNWTMLTATLPAGSAAAGTVYIRPVLATGNATGTIYFDDVKMVEGNPATINTTYDSTGTNVVTTSDPLGNQVSYQYDAEGNVIQETDPLGNVTTKTYDSLNRVTSVTVPGNDVMVNYTYDGDGNITGISTTDPTKTTTYNTIGMAYTNTGLTQSYTDPMGYQTTYSYTPGGLLQQVNKPAGDSLAYTYDKAGRITNVAYDGNDRYDLVYDNNGNLLSVADQVAGNTSKITYDNNNRIKTWSDGTRTISYTLDASGNITQKTLAVGSTTTQTETAKYSQSNQLITLTDASGAVNRFLYNDKGLLSMQKAGNGVTQTIDYDNDNHITNVVNQTSNGSVISSNQYTYDADGHILSITDNTGTTLKYTYTAKGQLASETLQNGDTVTYTYDPLGNRTQKQEKTPTGTVVSTVTYTYNKGNQLTQVGSTTYSYYQNGNEQSNGAETFKWDAAGRLIEVDNASGKVTYEYDATNRLVQETVNGTTTNFLYNGTSNHVLAEYDAQGNQTKYYTWGPNGLLAITVNGKTYYTVRNGHDDIVALTDASGNVVVTYSYDTWGNLINYTDTSGIGLAMSNPYRYGDYRYDAASSMYYLIQRWYDPTVGRFLSEDPHNIMPNYLYGNNNPVSFVDPNGSDGEEVAAVMGAVAFVPVIGEAADVVIGVGFAAYAGYEYATSSDNNDETVDDGSSSSDTNTSDFSGATYGPPYLGSGDSSSGDGGASGGDGGQNPKPDYGNIIKKWAPLKFAHIFSDKHVKNGIQQFGESEEEIVHVFKNIVMDADSQGLIQPGQNQIKTVINGMQAEIRVFIKDGTAMGMNGFSEWSSRVFKQSIYFP